MRSRRLILSLLGLCMAGPAAAQRMAEPPVGATLRWSDAGRRSYGTLLEPPEDNSPYRVLVRGTRDTVLVARTALYLAWKRHGSYKLAGAALGLMGGVAIGYAVGDAAMDDCTGFCLFDDLTRLLAAGAGGVVGTVAGVLIAPGPKWIRLGPSGQLGVVVDPGRVGLRLSF